MSSIIERKLTRRRFVESGGALVVISMAVAEELFELQAGSYR